jgi:hypothetical protein
VLGLAGWWMKFNKDLKLLLHEKHDTAAYFIANKIFDLWSISYQI